MTKQIIKISSSAIKDSACEWKYNAVVNTGLVEKLPWNDTFYGTCFHKFCYVMAITGGDFAAAHKECITLFRSKPTRVRDRKEHLTEKHLINTCLTYWNDIETNRTEFQPLMVCSSSTPNIVPLVEFNFSIPVLETEDYIVLLEGTIDRIGKIVNGVYCIRDFKTTSTWNKLKFLESFRASSQLKLYVWALKQHAKLHPGSALDEVVKFPIGAFIDGVFLKSAKETEFASSDSFVFKQWELDEVEQLLRIKAQEIVELKSKSFFNEAYPIQRTGKITGLCYTGFYCKYYGICHAMDEVVRNHIIKNNYTTRPFDPLNYDGE